jgi:hypothetical protein
VWEEDVDDEDEDEDEDYDDGVSPARKPKEWKEGPYDISLVHSVLTQNRATDICVVDISAKVDWVKYIVFATGKRRMQLSTNLNYRSFWGAHTCFGEHLDKGIEAQKTR